MTKPNQAVRISIRVDRVDGTYSELSGWFVPNAVAEKMLCQLVDYKERWSGTIKDVEEFLKSEPETIEHFKNKKNESI